MTVSLLFDLKARVICPVSWLVFALAGLVITVTETQAALVFETTSFKATAAQGEDRVPFVFAFKNAGDSSVEITGVKTSCGCTAAKPAKTLYGPGESGEIEGSFTVGNRQGVQRQSVTVTTSNLGQPEVRLEVEVTIPRLVNLRPGLLIWPQGSEPEPREIRVELNQELGLRVSAVETESEYFAVTLDDSSRDEGKLTILVSPLATDASRRALVKITATDGNGFERNYFAHAMVRKRTDEPLLLPPMFQALRQGVVGCWRFCPVGPAPCHGLVFSRLVTGLYCNGQALRCRSLRSCRTSGGGRDRGGFGALSRHER